MGQLESSQMMASRAGIPKRGHVAQVTGGMEGEVRVWNIGFQTQTMDASLKARLGPV